MLSDHPGQVAVISGRNKGKIDRMETLAAAGMNVLADKPWVIEPADLPKLETLLETAKSKHVVVYDGMTQRYEITCQLQKELVKDAGVFGEPLLGSPTQPGVSMESVHYLPEVSGGCAEPQTAMVLRYPRAGRRTDGCRDAPGGPGAMDAHFWAIARPA